MMESRKPSLSEFYFMDSVDFSHFCVFKPSQKPVSLLPPQSIWQVSVRDTVTAPGLRQAALMQAKNCRVLASIYKHIHMFLPQYLPPHFSAALERRLFTTQ